MQIYEYLLPSQDGAGQVRRVVLMSLIERVSLPRVFQSIFS
jgi:hypothetical protein